MADKLALFGGEKVKNTPYGEWKRFGQEELTQLKEALDQGTLFYWQGQKVKEMTKKFAKMYGSKYCIATSSGTASIHVALGVVGVSVGDEVITSPITDMGTVIGILYQNAIPVFADLDPNTYNMDPKSIEAKITDRTKAILVVHLAGNPADMDAIMDIAKRYDLKVVEDCAQSYMCRYKGRLVGTIGDVGCFSLNDFKHISAGDGGMCLFNDEKLYLKGFAFADKNYNRLATGTAMRNIPYLAPNYRMTELQGAVGIAQLDKLKGICERNHNFGMGITAGIKGLKGIAPHKITDGGDCTYWFYMFRVDKKELGIDRNEFAEALRAEGITCGAGYIDCCIYEYDIFKKQNAYPGTKFPFVSEEFGTNASYETGICPNAEAIVNTVVYIPVKPYFTDVDLKDVVKGINKVHAYYINKK